MNLYKEVIAGQTKYSMVDVYDVDHYLVSSGAMSLNNDRTSIRTNTLNYVDINFSGTLETTSEIADSWGLDFQILENVGFDISGSESSSWTARMRYNDSMRVYSW